MKKLLNTLYITTQGAYLHKEGLSLVVRIEKEDKFRAPIHNLEAVVGFGNVLCSPFLMAFCAENNVAISFLSQYGKFLATVRGPVSGNVLLRRQQYRAADQTDQSFHLARNMVFGKISNARQVLLRGRRDETGDGDALSLASEKLRHTLLSLARVNDMESLRGKEGDAAKLYFSCFNHLITQQAESFNFTDRNRRPPTDPVNCLLSFYYTLLMHDCSGALQAVGLDPAVGFLHTDRPGRMSLALDLMEELRAMFADRLTLSLINRKQIHAGCFELQESGAVWLNDKGRKIVLDAWQQRKQEEIVHPFIGEKIKMGLIPHVQATLLSRHLRGELDDYPPFLWK
ncbi:MAG: type I-C CRISPR-associated endonuclease Cas1c [Kiritimatiellae bacterium]|nr:type I-C CRISPR-associated endonuclease Cas1c [Kiritimatiellia bacterium]